MASLDITTLSNGDLLEETARVVTSERQTTARLIALLTEVETRGAHLTAGWSSLFTYCTQALHLSEHAAYERITAARLSRRFRVVLERLTEGSVTLTAVGLLGPHLTTDNCERLLEAARHRTKREVECLVASLAPQPDVAPSVRRLPAPRATEPTASIPVVSSLSPPNAKPRASRATVAPLAPERYLIKVTVSHETHAKLLRATDLLRHSVPTGDPAVIVDRALTLLVEQLEKTRLARVRRPRPAEAVGARGRYVPAQVRRLVWERDAGRCAFVGTHGRCTETSFLEFHHVVPYAKGGATAAENLALRCRSHNAHDAALQFGKTRSGPSSIKLPVLAALADRS